MTALPRRGRDASIETLRGLAVLMLVGAHVYGLDAGTGMAVSGDTVGRYINDSLEYIRMPLFTVISGYVYAMRPVPGWPAVPTFLKAKTRRLLLPLIPLIALIGLLQMVGGGASNAAPSVSDIARGYLYGYSHLWFLEALFLVMTVVAVLDATQRLESLRGWGATLAAGVVVYVLVEVPSAIDFFRLSGALLLFPFFILGYGLARHRDALTPRPVVAVLVAAFLLGATAQQVMLANGMDTSPSTIPLRALAVVVGLGGTASLFYVRRLLVNRPMAWIGAYAFTIYLLHTIAAAGSRFLLDAGGVDSRVAVFSTGMVAAILLPIAFERLFGRYNPIRVVLLGEKPLPRRGGPTTADNAPTGAGGATNR
ncbi:acyltransferase [Blastococcus montanus]|uniref:acyltransferase family protein n=1 Tax=Blastococcus montanus TaxID=3144973 RepID=UPI003208D7C4